MQVTAPAVNVANDQRLDFRPLTPTQRNHRPIHTHDHAGRSTRCQRKLLEDGLSRVALHGHIGRTSRLGLSADRRFTQVNAGRAFELFGGLREGHPSGQMHQVLDQTRRHTTGKQGSFLIEGEKALPDRRGRCHSCAVR